MNSSVPISRAKARLFGAILLVLLVAVPLAALELMVRGLGWQVPNDPFISFGRTTSFFHDFVEDGVAYKKVVNRELYAERELTFPAKKQAGVFRVFFLGGSASAGWPHPDGEAYSDYLEQALFRAYPDRKFEILNVSAHAYAAYRVRLIFEEVIGLEPDLLVIYSGNNEFIERRNYAVEPRWYDALASFANRSMTYRLVRGSPLVSGFFPASTLNAGERGEVAYEQWSKIEKLPLALRTDENQYRKLREHYEFSISFMAQTAKERGVPVILLTVPTNTRDWQPNVSVNSTGRESAWQQHFRAGRAALLTGDPAKAVDELTAAAQLDPEHAATQYFRGRALEAAGRTGEAHSFYDLARDLDANPFRAPSVLNRILRRIAEAHSNVRLVDADRLFREAAAPHAPGFGLFLDYVHPTRKGNAILAKAVFEAMASGKLGPATFEYQPERGEDGKIYEANQDHSLQRILVILAMMMNQNETVVRLADGILRNPQGLSAFSEKEARTVTKARELFSEAVELEHRELLHGNVSQQEKDELATKLKQLLQETFGNYAEFKP
jgi:tetratricopeptide (TPR) repeat protein